MTLSQDTSVAALKAVRDSGEDVTLRRRIATLLRDEPLTTHELTQRLDASSNAVRPRIDELLRMGCVRRDGTRTNPSGHRAYVNHLTGRGLAYARGEIDPEPEPPLSALQRRVVDVAREVARGNADVDVLHLAVEAHDSAKRRREQAISSADLAERTLVSASTVRDLIKEVRREYRLPIGNCQQGYFVIADAAEATRQIERFRRQAETSRQSARDVAAAWNRQRYGGERA